MAVVTATNKLLALLAAGTFVVACADTDPTSRVASPSAADEGSSPTSAVADSTPDQDVSPSPASIPAPQPSDTATQIDVSDVTTADPEPVQSDDGLVTDDPTFDVEPLRPFEAQVAVDAPPSGPGLDDAGSGQPTGWGAFDAHLDSALLRNGNTAFSVAVLIGGDVVHSRGFGWRAPGLSADLADTEDRFRIASISKTITAITLLSMVEDGLIGLDDPVGQQIADYLEVSPSAGAQQLTIRRLLTHTTGYSKYDNLFFRHGSDSCEDAARTGITRGGGGGGYTYSNMNYCIAGVLIEALSGQSYVSAVYERLLTPLGISGMRLANTFDPGPGEVLHATTPNRNYMETLGAAGSWIATPTDLVTIVDSLDVTTPGFKPLSPDMVMLMETPVGGQFGQRGYGLGLISYGDGRYGHTGTIESTHAMVLDRGDGVVWAITVAGPYPSDSKSLESTINRAFEAAGFIAG